MWCSGATDHARHVELMQLVRAAGEQILVSQCQIMGKCKGDPACASHRGADRGVQHHRSLGKSWR